MRKTAAPRCVLLGGGGHAKVLIDCMRAAGIASPYAILDADGSKSGQNILGVPIRGDDALLAGLKKERVTCFVVALGALRDATPRRKLFEAGLEAGFEPLTLVHPSACVSPTAVIGKGCQILAGSVVNTCAELGVNVIVNTRAVVEHDCVIGAHVHVASGAVLAGGVRVGEGSLVGAGAVVREYLVVGAGAIVGAGATVVREVSPETTVVGCPAEVLRRRGR